MAASLTRSHINVEANSSHEQNITHDREPNLKSCPSNFRVLVNTTVLAGMLSPIENVSVANKILIRPSCSICNTAIGFVKQPKKHTMKHRA